MKEENSTVFESIEELQSFLNQNIPYDKSRKGIFDLEDCHFKFDVNFENAKRVISEHVYFSNSVFYGKTSFNGIIFQKKANFDNCTFKKQVDFSNCIFENDINLFDSKFQKNSSFIACEFKGKVNAWNMSFSENVTFKWTNFRSKVNLSDLKAKYGKVELYGVNFEGNAYFYNSKIKNLDLKKSVIDKGLFYLGAEISVIKRETARIIKNEFLNQNNRIEALKYHQKEMIAYFKELTTNIFRPNSLNSFFKSLGDITILIINFISNGFGLWWVLSVIFLFTSTYLMFCWYLSNLNLTSSIEFWEYYPKFILPTHKFGFIENTTPDKYANLIDFFGRVVSSFGIYQTIQAFRKFGRF